MADIKTWGDLKKFVDANSYAMADGDELLFMGRVIDGPGFCMFRVREIEFQRPEQGVDGAIWIKGKEYE